MSERREQELALLREQYTDIRYDESITWVIVEDLPLPNGYNRSATDVLILIPSGYPETPPDNFYVPAGLRLEGNGAPDAFNANHREHEGKQWDRYSWHEDDGWAPATDIEAGSNLLTFMGTVEERLRKVE